MNHSPPTRTFDALRASDLDTVYQHGREEVLRDHAFRILLERCDTASKLEKLAFHGPRGLADWTTKELVEITNHFRLLSSPEDEIRLYRECRDEVFRRAPRIREFYLLALNKAGRPLEAIEEGRRIIAEGGESVLVWVTLGESYSARAFFAERLAEALSRAAGRIAAVDPQLLGDVPRHFSDVEPAALTVALATSLRQKDLRLATRIFRRGFRESGSPYSGLGWMLRTIDYLRDLAVERAWLQRKESATGLDADEALRLALLVEETKGVRRQLDSQAALVRISLEMQGGSDSLDYWIHAGILLLATWEGTDLPALHALLARLFAVADADFKLAKTAAELRRMKDGVAAIGDGANDTASIGRQLEAMTFTLSELDEGRARFVAAGGCRGGALNAGYVLSVESEPASPAAAFLRQTVNFRTLTASLVPLHIGGGIGRAGARVPDLLINRQVQEDLADLVETKILQPLALEERGNPRAVIARIQEVVGAGLKVGDLQDLQSPAHQAFEIRSDGLIALSGIDENMRKHTRTATELTAALLLQNGDCRETMYLNGALYACWQQRQVKKLLSNAMLCLELEHQEGFEVIVRDEIPRLMRHQLRGGQFKVYVDSVAVRTKYQCERRENDARALLRRYGIDELKAGEPLTRYELENAKIEVTYQDGSTAWLQPKDPLTGAPCALDHVTAPGGGKPVIANVEQVKSLRLLSLLEEHALTFLYDERDKTMELCDGFYNDDLFDSPYAFGRGPLALDDMFTNAGLIRAGSRVVVHPDATAHPHPVYLEFLPFSRTDYDYALTEGDIPGTIQLMGRIFNGDLKRERRRLDEGTSPIPELLRRIHQWQLQRQRTVAPDRKATERQLAQLILDLARTRSELVQMREVSSGEPLIAEEVENANVYLVLSGRLQVYRQGRPLCDESGAQIEVGAGGVAGEISALRGGAASATVAGDGVVLAIAMHAVQEHLKNDRAFRLGMEELTKFHMD